MIGNAIGDAFLPQQSFQNPHVRNRIVGVKPVVIRIDRNGILPLYIKKPVSAKATVEVAGCRFYDPHHSLRADLGPSPAVDTSAAFTL